MRFTSKGAVEYDLRQHYRLRDDLYKECKELSQFEGCRIKPSSEWKGKPFYSVRRKGSSKYHYAGGDESPEVIGIRRYSYVKKSLEVVESNIYAMENFLRIYQSTHADHISELLPKTYREIGSGSWLKREVEVEQWLKSKQATKDKFPIFDPASLKVTSFDDTLVRSRAEVIHHMSFYIYNVPAIFELPYEFGNDTLYPDFTALDVFKMRDIMLEHLGNWFHSDSYKRDKYRADSVHKWDQYYSLGFCPESNLLLTFGADDNHFDAEAIMRKIASLAFPPPSDATIEMLRKL